MLGGIIVVYVLFEIYCTEVVKERPGSDVACILNWRLAQTQRDGAKINISFIFFFLTHRFNTTSRESDLHKKQISCGER